MPNVSVTPYDAIAELYDLEHEALGDDVTLLRSIVDIVGDPVVELGCGSGRVLIPIARDGFSVTGVDISTSMLDRARIAVEHAGMSDRVTLVHGGMETPLPLPADTFGVALFSLNGLMHLTTQELQLAALSEAARLLDPRGQVVIDLFNPTPEYLMHLASRTHLETILTDSDGNEIEKWSHRTVRTSQQEIDTRIWYDQVSGDGQVHRQQTAFTLRYIHAAELALMLKLAGFVEWQFYGSYELDPYEEGSERLIALADLSPSH